MTDNDKQDCPVNPRNFFHWWLYIMFSPINTVRLAQFTAGYILK